MKKIFVILVLCLAIGTISAQSNQQRSKSQTSARKTLQKNSRPAQGATSKTAAKTSVTNFCPNSKHPHAIDLGLPSETLWACCNVGATTPEGFGGLYAIGELKEKQRYSHINYKYHEGSGYNNGYDYTFVISGSEKDIAHVKWGNGWEMPTAELWVELKDNCIFEYVTINGVGGAKVIGPNGNVIFLPGAGIGQNDGRAHIGEGNYSAGNSAGLASVTDGGWAALYFREGYTRFSDGFRPFGYSVRPVKDER